MSSPIWPAGISRIADGTALRAVETVGDDRVDRQHQRHAATPRGVERAAGRLDLVGLDERAPDRVAERARGT